jgi:beta-lactamase regulating signal transducer with metallopeptidase domain
MAVLPVAAAASTPAPARPARSPWTPLLALYACGAALLLVRLARQQRRLARLAAGATPVDGAVWNEALSAATRELGIRRPVRLVRIDGGMMPMTWGALRPVVAVPGEADGWPAERRYAVLLHELAHVARFDSLAQAAAAVVCALYWFHPGAWLAARQLRRESEVACDDRVLLAGARPHAYAGELLAVARSFSAAAPALAVGMASGSQLEGRLRALLDAGRARRAPGWPTRAAAALVTALVLASLASAQLTRRPGAYAHPRSADARTQAHLFPASARAIAADVRDAAPADVAAPAGITAAPALATFAAASSRAQEGITGRWVLEAQSFGHPEPGLAQLEMWFEPNDMTGTTVALARFAGLGGAIPTRTSPARFELRGEAGTIAFEGQFRDGQGTGTFRFTPAPGFAGQLQRRGLGTPTAVELARAVLFDVTLAKVDALLAVLPQKPAVDDMTRLIGHGVTPSFVRDLAAAGYRDVTAEDIIRLSNHQIDVAWIREIQSAGLRDASVEDLIRLRNHDVDAAWIRDMQSLGFRDAGVEGLIRLKNNHVEAGWIREMQAAGFRDLSPEDLVRMKTRGVDVAYVRSLRALGYADLSPEDVVRMRSRGVTPDFVRAENARRGTRLSPEELIYARSHSGG